MEYQYFFGKSVHKKVRQAPATSFRELVNMYVDLPMHLPISQRAYQKLSDEKKQEVKKTLPLITAAAFERSPCRRAKEHATHCNLIFLDIDVEDDGSCPAKPYVDNPDLLEEMLAPFSFCAYKTVSSTEDKPRLRIMVAAHEIPIDLYPSAVRFIAEKIGLEVITPESKVAVQAMFLPAVFADQNADNEHPRIKAVLNGKHVRVKHVPDYDEEEEEDGDAPRVRGFTKKQLSVEGDDGLSFLRSKVPEITLDIAKEALDSIDPDVGYFEWLDMAMALCHQFSPKRVEEAFDIFNEWSSKGSKYKGTEKTLYKWNHGVKPTPIGRTPITIRTLLHRAVEHGWQSAHVKEKCFAATKAWIMDEDRTETDLMSLAVEKIAGTPLLKHTEEDALLNLVSQQAQKRFKMKVSLGSMRTDMKRLRKRDDAKKEDEKSAEPPPWLKGWCYVAKPKLFFRHRTNEALDAEGFNNTYSKKLLPTEEMLEEAGTPITQANLSKPIMRPQDFALHTHQIKVVYDYEYDPGEPENLFTKKEGKLYINTYRKSYPESSESGSAYAEKILRRHLKVNFPDKGHRRHILDWMAYCVQFPGRKIRHAILLQGAQGCGKTFFAVAMAAVLGEEHVSMVDKNSLSGSYNEWAEGSQVVAIEEIRVVGQNKYDLMNALKPLITNPRITVNQKFRDTRTVRNLTNYFLFTNFHDALALARGDRRYYVLKSALQTKEDIAALGEDYFDELFGMLEEHSSGLRYFLENYDISDSFKPNGHAPHTVYLDEVIDDTSDEVTSCITRLMEDGDHTYVQPDFVVTSAILDMFNEEGVKRPSAPHLASVLRAMNFAKAERLCIDGGRREQVWIRESKLREIKDVGAYIRRRVREQQDFLELW